MKKKYRSFQWYSACLDHLPIASFLLIQNGFDFSSFHFWPNLIFFSLWYIKLLWSIVGWRQMSLHKDMFSLDGKNRKIEIKTSKSQNRNRKIVKIVYLDLALEYSDWGCAQTPLYEWKLLKSKIGRFVPLWFQCFSFV